jgi:hypothetical protein
MNLEETAMKFFTMLLGITKKHQDARNKCLRNVFIRKLINFQRLRREQRNNLLLQWMQINDSRPLTLIIDGIGEYG